jgi:stalled ribosome rescue protein Dom34
MGREEAERERQAARVRMLHTLGEHVRALSPVAAVFVGGTPQLVDEAIVAIESAGVSSVIEAPSLGARARVVEIARAVREGMSTLRRDADVALVDEVVRRFAADDLGAAGAAVTGRALDDRAVQTLVLSDSFVVAQPEVAEVFVRSALAQDADIRVITGDASRLLEESGGAGVLLRFSPFQAAHVSEGELASV